MVSNLKIRLQTSLHRPVCANGDYLYLNQIYSLQLETFGAFKIVIFRFTSQKFAFLNRKLQIDFYNGLNLENTIFPRFFLRPPEVLRILVHSNFIPLLRGSVIFRNDNYVESYKVYF